LLSKTSLLTSPLNTQPFVAMLCGDLLEILSDGIAPNVQYQRYIEHIVHQENVSIVRFDDGSEKTYDLIVSADGSDSDTRHKVFDMPELLDLNISNWRFCINVADHQQQPSYRHAKRWKRSFLTLILAFNMPLQKRNISSLAV